MRRNFVNQTRNRFARPQSTLPRKPKSAASWILTGGYEFPGEISSSAQENVANRRRPETTTVEEDAASSSTQAAGDAVVHQQQSDLRLHVAKSDVERFIEEALLQEQRLTLEENQSIPMPRHPDELVPEFRRFKRHAKHIVVIPDPEFPTFERKDQFVALPPPAKHPWVDDTVLGPHIVHGDGQLGVVGSGEVGFDADHVTQALPKGWRGLEHRSIIGRSLPDANGNILNGDTVVKHSLNLTGRGVFATKDVKVGDIIMVVSSTAQSLGLTGEQRRLVKMASDILRAAYEGKDEDREFLYNWILTGQLSSMVEKWPERLTTEVIEKIGGREVLDALELHPSHIARLAAVIDMNSFVVESSYDERRGMAYWPEAGFFNHSCDPNTTYEIVPDHMFKESEFFAGPDAQLDDPDELEDATTGSDAPSSSPKVQQRPQSPSPAGNLETKGDASVDHKPTPAMSSAPPPLSSSGKEISTSSHKDDGDDVELYKDVDLTAKGAPGYLFCVRATKEIAAGQEILISYVPTEWNFDARQYVLHDRYRFRCKCPRCAPTIDSKYAAVPRFMLFVLVFLLTMQLWLMREKHRLLHEDGAPIDGEQPRRKGLRYNLEGSHRESKSRAQSDLESTRMSLPVSFYANDPMAKSAK
jgi:hypothetical protein